MNWQDLETWEEAAKAVADLIEGNKELEQQLETYRQELTERRYVCYRRKVSILKWRKREPKPMRVET